jgi:hypothetical protein
VVERTGQFIKDKDLFGVGDILCIHKTTSGADTVVKIVQTTCSVPHVHKPFFDFANRFPGLLLEQWVMMNRAGWRVYSYTAGQKKPEIVIRERK